VWKDRQISYRVIMSVHHHQYSYAPRPSPELPSAPPLSFFSNQQHSAKGKKKKLLPVMRRLLRCEFHLASLTLMKQI
jgi:hypothetical protein